jgi:hypothetical protein
LQIQQVLENVGISFRVALRPSMDDTAGRIREKWLNLERIQGRISVAPVFPRKYREFVWIEQKLLKKSGLSSSLILSSPSTLPSLPIVTRGQKEIASTDKIT